MAVERKTPTIAIVGGGLAGLAAAVALAERGRRVELFEESRMLGGRASSVLDTASGEWIDHGQHVALGCCARLLDFCARLGAQDSFVRYERLHFLAPDARRYDFAPASWLPAPLHLLPGLLKLGFLSCRERWQIVRGIAQLVRKRAPDRTASMRKDAHEEQTIGAWLRSHGQTERAVARFWSLILVSALAETVDQASLAAARQVFVDGFCAGRGASDLLVPSRRLHELFHQQARRRLVELGVTVHLHTQVRQIVSENGRVCALNLSNGARHACAAAVAAVPWWRVRSLFSAEMLRTLPALDDVENIPAGAIAAVHLWFDRPVDALPHAVLVDRLGHWVFARDNYLQVVISAVNRLTTAPAVALQKRVCDKLLTVWPELRAAQLRHCRVITQPAAVFALQPGVERLRPSQAAPLANLFLAGDWTSTGWPATMEGAVRSGFQAAELAMQCREQSCM